MNSRQRRKLAAEQHNARLEREKSEGPTPTESRESVGTAGHVDHAPSRRRFNAHALIAATLAMAERTQEPKR